jgi:class 3 adenylate cyclase
MARRTPREQGQLSQAIREKVTASISKGLKVNPGFAEMVEAGLIDPEAFEQATDTADLGAMIRQFKDGVIALANEDPSKLEELHLRPLDVLPAPSVSEAIQEADDADVVQLDRAIVFTDLEGFTTYTRERGDVEASALLADHYDVVNGITVGRGGTVVKRLGDGHMLSFTEPEAAVLASLELVGESPPGVPVRTGAHQGKVIEMVDDLFGDVVNVAARVTDLAAGGESLVTVAVRDGAGPLRTVQFGNPTPQSLAGIDGAVDVCAVRSA